MIGLGFAIVIENQQISFYRFEITGGGHFKIFCDQNFFWIIRLQNSRKRFATRPRPRFLSIWWCKTKAKTQERTLYYKTKTIDLMMQV